MTLLEKADKLAARRGHARRAGTESGEDEAHAEHGTARECRANIADQRSDILLVIPRQEYPRVLPTRCNPLFVQPGEIPGVVREDHSSVCGRAL